MNTKTIDQRIVQSPDICGGKPRIAGHRITVQNVVVWYDRLGWSADQIASEYNLDLADIYAAMAYYFTHRDMIDESIQKNNTIIEKLSRDQPSLIDQKLEGKM